MVASHLPSLSSPRAGDSTQKPESKMYLLQFSIFLSALLNPALAVVSTRTTASSSTVSNPAVEVPYKNSSKAIKISTNSSLTNASFSNVSAPAADFFAQSEGTEQYESPFPGISHVEWASSVTCRSGRLLVDSL